MKECSEAISSWCFAGFCPKNALCGHQMGASYLTVDKSPSNSLRLPGYRGCSHQLPLHLRCLSADRLGLALRTDPCPESRNSLICLSTVLEKLDHARLLEPFCKLRTGRCLPAPGSGCEFLRCSWWSGL